MIGTEPGLLHPGLPSAAGHGVFYFGNYFEIVRLTFYKAGAKLKLLFCEIFKLSKQPEEQLGKPIRKGFTQICSSSQYTPKMRSISAP